MKFDIEKLGIHIDTENQPYLSYIIISIGLAIAIIIGAWNYTR